jgi:hypothetical protein
MKPVMPRQSIISHATPPTPFAATISHQSRKPPEVRNRRTRGETINAAKTTARAHIARRILTLASDNGSSSQGRGAGTSCDSAAAAGSSLHSDGGRRGGSARSDVLERSGFKCCAVRADGELLEVRHSFVAGGESVDAEDHANATVRACSLLAVEP